MSVHTEILLSVRRVLKFYDSLKKEVCQTYGLTPVEVDILAFLHNNPQRDTASDIVELRLLPKGNVSQGVEALIRKGLLTRRQDPQDRRRIHLALTPQAQTITPALEEMSRRFYSRLLDGVDEPSRRVYWETSRKMAQNAWEGLNETWISN